MSHTSPAEYVHGLLSACPALGTGPFDIALDSLDSQWPRYSVDSEREVLVMKRYLNGDTVRRFAFILTARRDALGNNATGDAHALYEAVARWAERMSRGRRLPEMGGGRRAGSLSATEGAALSTMSDDANTAIYRMRMELVYTQQSANQDGDESEATG